METISQNFESNPLLTGIVVLLIILSVYFFPTLVSLFRNTKSGIGIFLLNLFLGWTLIGYIAAFIWAFTAKTVKEYKQIYH